MRASTAPKEEKPVTLSEAKAKFSSIVDRALRGIPQRVVRNGREEVVIVKASSYDAAMRPKRSLIELFAPLRGVEIELERSSDEDTREVPSF